MRRKFESVHRGRAEPGARQLREPRREARNNRCVEIIVKDAPWLWIAQPGFQVSTRRDVTGINWYAGEGVDWSKVGYRS